VVNDLHGFFYDVDPRRWVARKFAMQQAVIDLLPGNAAARCMTLPLGPISLVDRTTRTGFNYRAYRGLSTCKNSWVCPFCAPHLALKRKKQIETAVKAWRGQRFGVSSDAPGYFDLLGYELRLALFTVSHSLHTPLKSLLFCLKQAFTYLKSLTSYRSFKERFCVFGTIDVLEVTYSKGNGWHPHFHILYFLKGRLDENDFTDELYTLWERVCTKFSLEVDHAGFGVQNADFISNYLTKYGRHSKSKWGVDDELSKWFVKTGRESFTPFDLLESHLLNMARNDDVLDDTLLRHYAGKFIDNAGKLFIEFANTFKGRHQIQWSRGLKKHFKIDDIEEDEVLSEDVLYEFPLYDDFLVLVREDRRYKFIKDFFTLEA
jgi:hypothetical protein